LDSEAVEQDAHGELAEHVGPLKGAEEVAEGDEGDAELGVEGVVGNGDIDPVYVVDEDSDGEEESDVPAFGVMRLYE
jgi:hypothetical protein